MSLSRHPAPAAVPDGPSVQGPVRVDSRTKSLTKRLAPGDIAVINHEDIDQVSACALVACRPAVVINAAASISGAYPNLGPKILLEAGIPLIDRAGEAVLTQVTEGVTGRVSGSRLLVGDQVVAEGTVLDHARAKARRKGADLLAVNAVGQGRGFGDVANAVTVLDGAGEVVGEAAGTKGDVARGLWDLIVPRLR